MQEIFAAHLFARSLSNSTSRKPLRMERCRPDTAMICERPVARAPFTTALSSPEVSPVSRAAANAPSSPPTVSARAFCRCARTASAALPGGRRPGRPGPPRLVRPHTKTRRPPAPGGAGFPRRAGAGSGSRRKCRRAAAFRRICSRQSFRDPDRLPVHLRAFHAHGTARAVRLFDDLHGGLYGFPVKRLRGDPVNIGSGGIARDGGERGRAAQRRGNDAQLFLSRISAARMARAAAHRMSSASAGT